MSHYDRETIRSWAETAGELDYLLEEQKRDNDPEYRQDDENAGYCPECSQPLSAITVGARGLCEQHGWQYANWLSPEERENLSFDEGAECENAARELGELDD